MQQWFQLDSYDVIASCTCNDDGTWQPMAVFSAVETRGAFKRPLSTCRWDEVFEDEQAAYETAVLRARDAASHGRIAIPGF